MDRTIGIKALGTILKNQKNCQIFEKYIYNKVYKCDNAENTYKWCIYQVVGLLNKEIKDMKKVADDVKDGKIGWKSVTYDSISKRIAEFDDYLVNPFEVVEGISECKKCGSKKTWNVQKQTRRADESSTTFSRCVMCGHQWSYAG
jgi:DNA-directed RNA polymerase subunit M/transcription elongation factor TFIIS